MSIEDMIFRLGLASVAGILLGLDREFRGIAAGIRTHALVALSSAMITLSAMLLYEKLSINGGSNVDPLRVVQGLAQAVGFIAAGSIFFSKGNVHNLTSAANIWLAAAAGIASGAGQTMLLIIGVGFGAIIVTVVRLLERLIPGSSKAEDD
ncbi:putative Mg2+ transporter-C (MgtC) family protein [Agrobacterium tumefaciens]|uniref:Protein MgtC n=1 Tax=Agrobacterium radiobacter TaxID=362 RepID=A0ABR6JDN2_AGRRD|nr:MgtC/SapB family protein [Agrobacterium radiobacter]MBB4320501.1 putative Mg2+ transporter-C (MgtC) family protein [Agrobacterium radiobacter]MBB4337166.1 putative Mg2+ transporter-C (MgtC) family protein [Agrobacterium radiobacter]MBB4492586.1 putative Mg2+ transporter-C (MgtC) family protein [Agrobacterium radiobacter]MBB4497484.1 putative Mg2+ transporter-C (MgtC) family protein [Agrobacterium radiobacter]MBB4502605.1 putative Mg2+ transporter-C (MgtC) family protein [Agrobacterium radio